MTLGAVVNYPNPTQSIDSQSPLSPYSSVVHAAQGRPR